MPPDFRFAVKASRYLTHVLRLRQPHEAVERMLDRIEPLGDAWARARPAAARLPLDAEALDASSTAFDVFGPAGLRRPKCRGAAP